MPPIWKETLKEIISEIDPWLFGWTIVVMAILLGYLASRIYAVIYLWGIV